MDKENNVKISWEKNSEPPVGINPLDLPDTGWNALQLSYCMDDEQCHTNWGHCTCMCHRTHIVQV